MTTQLNTANTSTPYDDAYRTLLTDCSELIIPVVNEIFKKNHGENEKVILFQNEFFYTMPDSTQKGKITDSNFIIGSVRYHLECQSNPDGTIMFRVFEYDSQLALKNCEYNEKELLVRFPNTALIYLRHTKNTPEILRMTIEVPGGSCSYDVHILKVQNYSLEEILEKKLFFLIPFHLFTYENDFHKCDTDDSKLDELTRHYAYLMKCLNESVKQGLLNVYTKNTIVAMTKKVMNHLTKQHSKVKERLDDVMGGKILDYEAKDILRQGIAQGEITKLVKLIKKKLDKGQSLTQIAEALEENVDTIEKLIKEYLNQTE